MHRSVRAALAALLLTVTTVVGVGAVAAPASAAGCTTKIVLPKRIGINKPYTEVKVPLSSTCSQLAYADAYLVSREGIDDVFFWDPAYNGAVVYWDLYDFAPMGSYKTREGYAEDVDYNELPVTEAATTVKLSSKAGISTSRSGNYVTITGSVSRYSPTYGRFRPWATKARVDVLRPDGTWAYVRTLTTTSKGGASIRVYNTKAATYRVRVADVWNTWGTVSANSRR